MMKVYDCIIVGNGPAGLSAALYLLQANKSILIISTESSNLDNIIDLQNYPGYINNSEMPLKNIMIDQLKYYKYDNVIDDIRKISKVGEEFRLNSYSNNYVSRSIILAVGRSVIELPFSSDYDRIHYCALCDGPFYRSCNLAVIGSGDTAVSSANYLINTNKVTLLCRRDKLKSKLSLDNKVKVLYNYEIVDINNQGNCIFSNSETSTYDAYFVCIGSRSNLYNIEFNKDYDGLFIAGDCNDDVKSQVIISAGDGASKAIDCINYLNSLEVIDENSKFQEF